MYLSIAIKLLVGMLGVIFFLRISGKTQMAQLTPLDSVNSFVLGALVGGVIYNPDTPVWYLVFAFAVWTAANVSLRYLMRFHRIRRAIKGDSVMLVRDRRLVMREFRRNGLEMEQFRTMLRENGIFSMFDVDDVRFDRLGVFAYSEEEGTYSAQALKDDVPDQVKQQRVERIMTLQNDIARENNLRRVGRTERVLIDSRQGDYYVGRTQYDSPEVDQEILIPAAERRLLRGHFYEIRIDGAADYDLYGKAVGK